MRAIRWPGLPWERQFPGGWVALALACAVVPPPAFHAALAAVAGTLFEAAPFVLATSLLGRLPFGASASAVIGIAGCGCRNAKLPGALALPAIALCALAFGWPIALARTLGSLVFAAILRKHDVAHASEPSPTGGPPQPQPFEALAGLIPGTLAAVLLRDVVAHMTTVAGTAPPALAVEIAFGALLGSIVPCATAGIAIAAAFHRPAPAVTIGILVTCGLVSHARASSPFDRASRPHSPNAARFGFAIVAVALGVVACGGATGFVSPRLSLPIGIGAALAAVCVLRPPPGVRPRWLVPLVLFGAIVAGSPAPTASAEATTLEDAYPGEALAFTGRAHRSDGRTILERSLITCCRIDARVVAIELDVLLPVAAGSWIDATGILVRGPDARLRLHLATGSWRSITPPHDPFAYR